MSFTSRVYTYVPGRWLVLLISNGLLLFAVGSLVWSIAKSNVLGILIFSLWVLFSLRLRAKNPSMDVIRIKCQVEGIEVQYLYKASIRIRWSNIQVLRIRSLSAQECTIETKNKHVSFLIDDPYGLSKIQAKKDLIQTIVEQSSLTKHEGSDINDLAELWRKQAVFQK